MSDAAEVLEEPEALELEEEKPKRGRKKEPPPPPVIVRPKEAPTTEELLCSVANAAGWEPTDVQRAICRASDGVAFRDLWKNSQVREAFGGKRPPTGKRPRTLVVLASTRGAKSLIAACSSIRGALICDVDGLVASDQVLIPCLATHLETAAVIHGHALSLCATRFPGSLIGRPKASSFKLAREGISHVEIATKALSSKGSALVARWLGGVVFDEAPRMGSERETTRSLKSSRRAVADRILPGGQELLIGSPYAPHGEIYELVQERFGEPDEDVVVIRATGPMLNPKHWTPTMLDFIRRTDYFVYLTSGMGQWADPPSALIPTVAIDANRVKEPERRRRKLPPNAKPGERWSPVEYVAAIMAAERGAGWTLVIVGTVGMRDGQKVLEQAVAQQWFGTLEKPLEASSTLRDIRDKCQDFGIDAVHINAKVVSSYQEAANELGLGLIGVDLEGDKRVEMCNLLRAAIVENRLSLCSSTSQKTDLQRVIKKPTVNGETVQYPSSGDGENGEESTACDHVPPLGMCVLNAAEAPVNMTEPEMDPFDEMMRDDAMRDPFEAAALGVA